MSSRKINDFLDYHESISKAIEIAAIRVEKARDELAVAGLTKVSHPIEAHVTSEEEDEIEPVVSTKPDERATSTIAQEETQKTNTTAPEEPKVKIRTVVTPRVTTMYLETLINDKQESDHTEEIQATELHGQAVCRDGIRVALLRKARETVTERFLSVSHEHLWWFKDRHNLQNTTARVIKWVGLQFGLILAYLMGRQSNPVELIQEEEDDIRLSDEGCHKYSTEAISLAAESSIRRIGVDLPFEPGASTNQ